MWTIDSGIAHAALAEQSLTQASFQELSQPFGWMTKLALLSRDLGYPYTHADSNVLSILMYNDLDHPNVQ